MNTINIIYILYVAYIFVSALLNLDPTEIGLLLGSSIVFFICIVANFSASFYFTSNSIKNINNSIISYMCIGSHIAMLSFMITVTYPVSLNASEVNPYINSEYINNERNSMLDPDNNSYG